MQVSGQLPVSVVLGLLCQQAYMLTEFEELEQLLENYDKRVRPGAGGTAVTVRVSVYVLNIPEIRFGKHGMEMTVDMYFRQFWQDTRLQRDKPEKILGERDIVDKIWVPDTFFANEHSSQAKEVFLRITNDGSVLWSQKLQVTFTAYGDYTNFPFDSQVFPLEFESFKYTSKDIRYGWQLGDQSVQLSPGVGFTDLTLAGHAQREMVVELEIGDYSRVWIEIQVDRNSGFYFSILFTPLFLTTMISLASFWINSAHRLLFIILINLFTIMFKVWFRVVMIPPVSYSSLAVEYIDLCLGITFLVLIEIIVMSIFGNPIESERTLKFENINLNEESNIEVLQPNSANSGYRCFGIYCDHFRIHDISKLFIPTLFLIFQVCFWLRVIFHRSIELEGLIPADQ